MSDPTSTSTKDIEQIQTELNQLSARLPKTDFTLKEFSGWLAFGIPALYLLMAVIEGSSYIWRPIAAVLYIALIICGAYLLRVGETFDFMGNLLLNLAKLILVILAKLDTRLADISFETLEKIENAKKELEQELEATELKYYSEWDLALPIIGGIAVLVGFSQLSRHLSILLGGFTSNQLGYWHWLRFGFSTLLESVLFDLPTIFEWQLSEIRPISTWSRVFIFLFRTTVEFFVVVTILRQSKTAWKVWARQPLATPKNHPRNFFALIILTVKDLVIFALWGLPIVIGIAAVVNDGLSYNNVWSLTQLAIPVFLGIGLVLCGLRGLGLPRWNKLLAGAGLVIGIWVTLNQWSAFWSFFGAK